MYSRVTRWGWEGMHPWTHHHHPHHLDLKFNIYNIIIIIIFLLSVAKPLSPSDEILFLLSVAKPLSPSDVPPFSIFSLLLQPFSHHFYFEPCMITCSNKSITALSAILDGLFRFLPLFPLPPACGRDVVEELREEGDPDSFFSSTTSDSSLS